METPKIIALITLICIIFNAAGQVDTLHKKKMSPPDMVGTPDEHIRMSPTGDSIDDNMKKYHARDSSNINKRKPKIKSTNHSLKQ